MTDLDPPPSTATFGDDTGTFEALVRSSIERLEEVLANPDAPSRKAALNRLVGEVADRIFEAIEAGLAVLAKIEEGKKSKIARSWQPAASRRIREIESAGSLVPGLSHQDIYVAELRAAHDSSDSMESFFARLAELETKWGSRMKYPLFAGARRKELDSIRAIVSEEAPKERKRLEGNIDRLFAPELEQARDGMRKRIRFGVDGFGGLVADALLLPGGADFVMQMRWFLIEGIHEQMLTRLGTRLDPADEEYRNGLYFAVEQLLLKVFETFKGFLGQSKADSVSARHPKAADLVEITDLEINRTNAFLVATENRLNRLVLTPPTVLLAKGRLRTGDLATARDQKAFLELCAQLSAGRTFESFCNDKKPVPGLSPDERSRIVNALREDVEPIRTLYYVQITLFRYLKGLAQFRKRME
jgi:hypothetical protein